MLALVGCNNEAGRTVKTLGSGVQECCRSLRRVNAADQKTTPDNSTDKSILPLLPASMHEIPAAAGMLTW